MSNKHPAEFRFYYFTNHYKETVSFYRDILQLEELRSWDRGELQKGTIFRSPNGIGFIEIEEGTDIPVLHGGLYIEVEDVDQWHEKLVNKVNMIQPLMDTSYGHRSFKFEDPNGFTIGFFRYL